MSASLTDHASAVRSPDGTLLDASVVGPADGPTVVLCHGLGLTRASWGRVPELLGGAHRVVAYDLRGHGASGRAANGDYGLPAHAADLAAVLAASVPDGDGAVVVGHSLGGGIVLACAHEHGTARMSGAVFAGSSGSAVTLPGLPPPPALRWARRPLRAGWERALRVAALVLRHLRPVHPLADALVRRFAFEPDPPHGAVRQVREHFAVARPEVLTETTLASGSHDGLDLAGALDRPALVVHGEHDPQVSEENARLLVERLPQGRLVQVAGGGHMLPLTHPEVVAAHVATWASDRVTA